MLLILIIIILVVFYLNKNEIRFNDNNYSDDAVNILNKRFINGEIDEEEYITKKQLILNRK